MKTRYSKETGIHFRRFGKNHFQHVDMNDGSGRPVGPIYKSQAELLADHERYLIDSWGLKVKPRSRIEERYVAVRKTEGREWFDLENTISLLSKESKKQANALDQKIPHWSKDNPVVRIAKIYISENHPYFK